MSDINLKTITFPQIGNKYLLGDPTLSISGTGADSKATGDALATKANVDGSYESMTVGNAEQLVSNVRVNDKEPYLFRTSGGSVDIGDREYVNGITGVSLPWNQLVLETQLSDHYVVKTFVDGKINLNGTASGAASIGLADALNAPNHKMLVLSSNTSHEHIRYFFRDGTNSANIKLVGYSTEVGDFVYAVPSTCTNLLTYCIIDSGTELNNFKFRLQIFDLTQMFGSTIADYIYSLEQATAGSGVAWFKKIFNKPYYAYNAGELKSVSGLVSHDMNGFNQWDEEWEVGIIYSNGGEGAGVGIRSKNFMPCVPSAVYRGTCPSSLSGLFICWYDADKTFISRSNGKNDTSTAPSNASYFKITTTNNDPTTYSHDICINLHWDGSRDGEYEPYVKHSYPLDSDLTLRGIPKLDANNSLYYDGDEYLPNGTVNRRFAVVDMSTLTWTYDSSSDRWQTTTLSTVIKNYPSRSDMLVSDKWIADTSAYNGDVGIMFTSQGYVFCYTSDSVNTPTGYLVYELSTPTTETADPYQQVEIVSDFGTEEFVIDDDVFAIPVGHNTDYPIDLKAKLEMAPNSPDGDGMYVVKQTNGMNEYVPLIIPSGIPSVPTTDGSYTLTATVSGGTTTLSWS